MSKNVTKNRVEEDTVISVMERNVDEIYDITLEDGKELHVTGEHPVHTPRRGWVPVASLKEGDDVDCWDRKNWRSTVVSRRMKAHNPMRNKDSVAKMSASMKKAFASGKLEGLRKKLSHAARRNIIAYNKRKTTCALVTARMTAHNPMKDPAVAKRMGDSMREGYANGTLPAPWSGKKRPDVAKNMREHNPMQNPKIRRRTLKKIVASWIKNGRISEGEIKVRESLSRLGVDFVHQAVFPGPKRDYVLDFLLPTLKCCVEYDGHSRHYTPRGMEKAKERDAWLTKHGIRTVRIHRDMAFIKPYLLDRRVKALLQ